MKKSYEDKFAAKLGAKGAKGAKDLLDLDHEADGLSLDRADLADAKPIAPRGGVPGAKVSSALSSKVLMVLLVWGVFERSYMR